MTTKSNNIGYLTMVFVVIIYGMSYISRDIVGQYMHSTVIAGFQLTIMAISFTILNLVKGRSLKINKKDIPMICFSGLFGTSIFQILTTLSVSEIGPDISSLLFGFAVVFALLIEIIFLKRTKTKLSIIGIMVSFVGLYILMGIDFNNLPSTNFKGYIISIASVLSWVIFCFLSDKISNKYDKTIVLNYQAIAGAITSMPFILLYPINSSAINSNEIHAILIHITILGLFNATLAKFLNIYSIKKIGVTMSNLMLNFLPVATIIIGFIMYGNIPTINQIAGGIIIILSVFILNKDISNLNKIKKVNTGKNSELNEIYDTDI